jgi:pyruvate dehydrogenase E1 component beta subunit
MKGKSEITFAQAINQSIDQAMDNDPKVLCYGLGVTDPKAVFGTTKNLEEKYGSQRVFDIPCSENAITGVGVGAALLGYKSIMTHQRLDFFMLAMDQLVNSAAKWNYMFGGDTPIQITIRLILGRGWGQGPTHSQNLQSWFAHIPGLKVVSPSNAYDAKGLLKSSIFDPNPVIFLEHRWLHNSKSEVDDGNISLEIGKANIVRSGKDITIVASSYLVPEAIDAGKYLYQHFGISSEIIDLRTIRPLDTETIISSVAKTKRVLCIDPGASNVSVSSEIVCRIVESLDHKKILSIKKLAMPDFPEPTSYALTKDFYNNADTIINSVLTIFGKDEILGPILRFSDHHDVPGKWFQGPF